MSELRKAAQAVVDQWDTPNWKLVVHTGVLIDRLRAALAEPEIESEPVAWQARHIWRGKPYGEWRTIQWETLGCTDLVPAMVDSMRQRLDYEMRPLYAHPPRDEWRPASEPPEDGRDVVVWMNDGGHGCFAIGHCLRGEWSPNYLGSPVTHWRDVTPPTESPIAAKCQRIEGSGEIGRREVKS